MASTAAFGKPSGESDRAMCKSLYAILVSVRSKQLMLREIFETLSIIHAIDHGVMVQRCCVSRLVIDTIPDRS